MSLLSEKAKGSLSGLEFRVLAKEIGASLASTYVSNIYSIGESQLLRMRRGGEDTEVSIVLSPRFGAWITDRPARVETTAFTTALRARLLRARLASVTQWDLDRVMMLDFEAKGEEGPTRLVLEIMPPGNIVLVGVDRKVALALREVRTESRRIAKGYAYSPPAQTRASLDKVTRPDIEGALRREKTFGRALGRGLSVPRRYVDEILGRLSHGQDDPSETSEAEVNKVLVAIHELLAGIEEKPSACLVLGEKSTVEVMVARPTGKEVIESSATLSPLLDKLFFADLLTTEEEQASRAEREAPGGKQGGAHERRAEEYKATIADLEKKKSGLQGLSSELRRLAPKVREAPDEAQALEVAMATDALPSDLAAQLEAQVGKGRASISSAIFDRAKRTEREIMDIDDAIKGLRAKLKKESGRVETVRVKAVSLSRAKKEWYEKFRWFFTTEGKLAIGGRDAQSNSTLIRRHMEDGDTVYHADLFGSPFFVLKGGKGQSDREVREVAKATVTFSSAWKTGLGAADAYWVTPDQVGSAGPSGEYLAHGSFAIKGKKNFVTKNPVEVAVGIDDAGRVISGPEEAVMRAAKGHVSIVPSREKPSDTAKKVLHELAPYANPQVSLGVDDVLRMLPAGGGKIVRRRADKKSL